MSAPVLDFLSAILHFALSEADFFGIGKALSATQ
jgi:hypothetical protein